MSEVNRIRQGEPTAEQIKNGWAWCDCGWEGYPEMQEDVWVCPKCYPKFRSEGCLGDMEVSFYANADE